VERIPTRRLCVAAACVAFLLLSLAQSAAAAPKAHFSFAMKPITFGIYPGGGAGTFGPQGRTLPEDPVLRLDALKDLRGGARPFVLHLYDEFTKREDAAKVPVWLTQQIAEYTAAGFQMEIVLRYRPEAAEGDVPGYLHFVRSRALQLGANPAVVGLQITNEANVTVAPGAADGWYKGATDALVGGVIAAKRTVEVAGFDQLRIGFNWAHQKGRGEELFWERLRYTAIAHDGAAWQRSVDWVGLDVYPGTWGPWVDSPTLGTGAQRTTVAALKLLRKRYLPIAGLDRVPLHVSEAGYPTGPGRSDTMQQSVLESLTRAVGKWRTRFGVTDLRWFDLRDADSSSSSFESQYGLMRDDYTPKPAFHAYRAIIASAN
jgi:hypothetical protein